MTKQQLLVIWIVGLLVAGLLFYIGIVRPHLLSRDISKKLIPGISTPLDKLVWEQETTPRLYVGGLIPILIIGACAFLSTMRKK